MVMNTERDAGLIPDGVAVFVVVTVLFPDRIMTVTEQQSLPL